MEENNDIKNYYEILNKIATGGESEVFKAKHKASNELRAIKIYNIKRFIESFLSEYLREPSEEEIKPEKDRILNEIKIMKLIQDENKDNTVRFYEYFENKNEIFIVTELCDCNLGSILSRNSLNTEKILEILTQLNNTFKILYENKIVHRNLKIGNIFLKYENKEQTKYKVKLGGYSYCEQLINLEYLSEMIGTVNYIAPEILKGEKYNQECDLWSLGIIIYIMYFKQFPYKGNNFSCILNQIKSLGSKAIKKTGNKDLDDLIAKLLVKDPRERITWEDYFEHPFFKNNSKDNPSFFMYSSGNPQYDSENKKQNDKIINEGENDEINELKKLLQNEKNKNDDLMKKINKLENELKEEKDKCKKLEEKTNKLKLELDNATKNSKTNIIQGFDNKLNNYDSKELLYKIILEKDEKIKELEIKLKRFPFELNEGEELISVNFSSTDQKVQNYSIICKNTEIFNMIEKKLYEDFKEYYDTENYFTFKGKRVHKLRTLKENGIKNNDVIVINIYDL